MNVAPQPAKRDALKEEPCDALLLIVQEGQKLRETRRITARRIQRTAEIVKHALNRVRSRRTMLPVLQDVLPVKDTARGSGTPDVRHFVV